MEAVERVERRIIGSVPLERLKLFHEPVRGMICGKTESAPSGLSAASRHAMCRLCVGTATPV